MSRNAGQLPLIRLSSINPFLAELEKRGGDASSVLRSLYLPDDVPASAELFVAAFSIYELAEKISAAAGDTYFGFTIGRSLDPLGWEPMARAATDAKTISDLLNRFVVYSMDHSSATRFFLQTEGARTTFGFRRTVNPERTPAQIDAFYVGLLSSLLIQATGTQWDTSSVLFEVPEPDVIPPRERLRLAAHDGPGPRINLPTTWLLLPYRKAPVDKAHADTPAIRPPATLLDSVHHALQPYLHQTDLTVEKAAEICGYKKRLLSRELKQKGTTLSREIASLRSRRAQERLMATDERIADIAMLVGFTDPTVFSRAFKNWTGQSPQSFRKRHRE